MAVENNLLNDLLSVATEELQSLNRKNVLVETNIFEQENNVASKKISGTGSLSAVHNGDTDSSDDEGNKNYENAKYNECGKQIKQLLGSYSLPKSSYSEIKASSSWKSLPTLASPSCWVDKPQNVEKTRPTGDVYSDPIFGLRIVNPLISSTALMERMVGREAVTFARISRYLQVHGKEKDWVIAGVIANKSASKTSQKGSQFCIWTLTDLKDDIKTVSLFLFSGAYKQLWKTTVGTVVGILNPNVLDKRDGSKDEASLSVDNAQKVMIFGQSKDFGTCKSVKKNGENCNSIVNLNRCEFCVYHLKQEYQKCSKRSELQANFAGRGLTALRNKVLGKNEVFYAGKSYTAIPAKKSKRMETKDNSRLLSLSKKGISINSNSSITAKNKKPVVRKQNASRLEVSQAQRLKDINLLKKLGGYDDIETKNNFTGIRSTEVTLKESKNKAVDVISKLREKQNQSVVTKTCNSADTETFEERLFETTTLGESQLGTNNEISKLRCKTDLMQTANSSKENDYDTSHLDGNISDTELNLDYGNIDFNLPKEENLSTLNKQDKIVLDNHCAEKMPPSNNFTTKEFKESAFVTTVKSNRPSLNSVAFGFPILSAGTSNMIDLNKPIASRRINKAKLNAINIIKKTGPIKKADPNNVKGSGIKRPLDQIDTFENATKKSKLAESEFISERFKKMMAATSKHLDLLESRDEEEKEKYFTKMERKEQMEEKMANTFKVACKAVKCLQCKYTNFSASDLCKNERHPLKVFDAMKRFFKCGNCGNRIASLDIIPTGLCKNCGSGKWEKTGMMKEKVCTVSHSLSIRGGEQKFLNSVVSDSNLSLLLSND